MYHMYSRLYDTFTLCLKGAEPNLWAERMRLKITSWVFIGIICTMIGMHLHFSLRGHFSDQEERETKQEVFPLIPEQEGTPSPLPLLPVTLRSN